LPLNGGGSRGSDFGLHHYVGFTISVEKTPSFGTVELDEDDFDNLTIIDTTTTFTSSTRITIDLMTILIRNTRITIDLTTIPTTRITLTTTRIKINNRILDF